MEVQCLGCGNRLDPYVVRVCPRCRYPIARPGRGFLIAVRCLVFPALAVYGFLAIGGWGAAQDCATTPTNCTYPASYYEGFAYIFTASTFALLAAAAGAVVPQGRAIQVTALAAGISILPVLFVFVSLSPGSAVISVIVYALLPGLVAGFAAAAYVALRKAATVRPDYGASLTRRSGSPPQTGPQTLEEWLRR